MYIRVKVKDGEDIVVLSKFAGVAPCQILTMNGIMYMDEIVDREVVVKVSLPSLVREVGGYYVVKGDKIVLNK